MVDAMKSDPGSENEIKGLYSYADPARNRVTPVAKFEPSVAQAIVQTLAGIVQEAHRDPTALIPDENGIHRAQNFEEGDVYMLSPPFPEFFADRYLMDLYDVAERGTCSRMHIHTGLRYVRMMTGPATSIRVSSLSTFVIVNTAQARRFALHQFEDMMPPGEGSAQRRYNLVIPENSWVDMQIPRGVSHQFNALGAYAIIDSVHPEESIETFREKMSTYKMMAQTIFLAKHRPDVSTCTDTVE